MSDVIMPVLHTAIQGNEMTTSKHELKTEMVRHTKASKVALDYLVSVLGDRFNKSDIIREAIILMAEKEREKREKQNT